MQSISVQRHFTYWSAAAQNADGADAAKLCANSTFQIGNLICA